MYNCGIRFGEVLDYPLRCLLISPDIEDESTTLEDAQDALAHVAGVVLNYFIDKNIPHNILVADEGMTMYIIPRKFDMLIENVQVFTSFETLCGVIKCKTAQEYETIAPEKIAVNLEESVSYSKADFESLKQTLVDKFLSEYQGE